MRSRKVAGAAVGVLLVVALSVPVLKAARDRPSNEDLVRLLDDEFQNGGLYQYFWNTRGKYNKATLTALKGEGLTEHAQVFSEAVARFDEELPAFEAQWRSRGSQDQLAQAYSQAVNASAIPALDQPWLDLGPLLR